MSALTNTAVFRLLLTIVLLSPLPLGGYRPWAWSLLAVLVGSLLLVWCLSVFAGVARAPVPMSGLWVVAVPFALCLAWGGAQTLTSTPESWWHPLWTEAGHALGAPVAGGISIDPEMTRTAILRLVTYGGVFWLSVQLGRDRSRARQALVAVAGAGAVYATYGLFVHFAGWERILWLEKWAYLGDLTATFVNRNAYGAYAGLGVICCMALFFHAVRPPRAGQSRSAHDLAEAWLLRAVPYLLSALVIGSALLLSHSRGAFLSTGAGLVALMAAVMAAGLIRPRTALILGLIMAGLGLAVLGLSGDGTVQRLAATPDQVVAGDDRATLYRLTMVAIQDAPWTGHGFGAFLPAFRMYRDTALPWPSIWDFAHNVFLEMAMDLGLPAAALLGLSLLAVVWACLRGIVQRRRDQIYPAAAVAAAVLIGAHDLVDFSAQMPAVAVTLALLLGVGFAQSRRTADSRS